MGPSPLNGKSTLVFLSLALLWATNLTLGQDARTLTRQAADLQSRGKPDSALILYQTALTIPGKPASLTLRCMNGIADNLLVKGYADSARVIAERALRMGQGEETISPSELSQTYATLAILTAYGESDLAQAVAYAHRSCELRQQRFGPESPVTAGSYYVLGYALKKAGMLDSAIAVLSRALLIQERSEARLEAVPALIVLGSALENTGRYAESVRTLEDAVGRLDRAGLGASEQALSCHSYLSSSHSSRGEIREALDHAGRALSLSIRLHGQDAVYTSGCYAQLGELLASTGDYERAFDYCSRSLAITDSSPGAQPSGVASVCRMLSRIERRLGRPSRALPYVRRGLSIVRQMQERALPETALLLDEAALVCAALGERDQALAYCRESLGLKRSLSAERCTVDMAATHLHMAEIFRGNPDSVVSHLRSGERILEVPGNANPLLLSRIWSMRGDLESGNARAAAQGYQRSLAALDPGLAWNDFWQNPGGCSVETGEQLLLALAGKARELRKLAASGDTACGRAALSALDAAAHIAWKMQRSFPLQGSKLAFRERTAALYRAGVESGAFLREATGDVSFAEWAFRFAERSKSGLLFENLERLGARRAGSDNVGEKERLLLAGIQACEVAVEKAALHGRSDEEPRRRLFTLRQELGQLPDAEDTTEEIIPAIDRLRQGMPEKTAILEYAKTNGRLAIFVITPDQFRIRRGPDCARLGEQVRSLRKSIKTVDFDRFLAGAGRLYRDLITPVQDLLKPGMRLVIVPDEELALLPFETLIPPRAARAGDGDFSTLPYLLRSHEISYAPSVALFYRHISSSGAEPPRSFAGFAPVFRDSTEPRSPAVLAALRSIDVDGKEFGELKYSEEEVRSILESFRTTGVTGSAYLHGSATKTEVLRALETDSYVHLATHGFANDSLPGLSGLVLAAPDGSNAPEVLYARETYGIRSHADLLVLSACETGLGKIVRGEGVMALTHGFLSAGVQNVVYSLWRVMDRPSSELMIRFYRAISRGGRYEDALRRAKLELITKPETAFPYFWAGFVLLHG